MLLSLARRAASAATGAAGFKAVGAVTGAAALGAAALGPPPFLGGTTVHLDAPSAAGSQDDWYLKNGLIRSVVFYWHAMPIYTQYKLTEWWFRGQSYDDCEDYYEFLHDRHSPTAEYVCLKLKGFYLKGAQVASTRDDLLPRQYLDFCKRFQDEVPSELADGETLERTICASLGIDAIGEVFESIDPEPIGAASIGVVRNLHFPLSPNTHTHTRTCTFIRSIKLIQQKVANRCQRVTRKSTREREEVH